LLVVGLALSTGCTDQAHVEALERQIAVANSRVDSLRDAVVRLEVDASVEKTLRRIEKVAYLTPGSDGYSAIQSDIGRLTVSLDNIQPYANGARVTLRFGNLTSATINGAKAEVEWGSVDDKGSPINEAAKTREVSFTQSLKAGAWTTVQVVLEGVPPTELGFVRIRELTHTGISLLR
jgi:TolA-binding protein